jgi:plastocyanin
VIPYRRFVLRVALMIAAAALALGIAREPETGLPATRVGSISGRVVLQPPPPPRKTSRARGYTERSAVIQQLPAVAYLTGSVPGGWTPGSGALEMMQQDTAFAPPVLPVPVGSTVAFPNGDPFFHNVFSYSEAKRFDLGRYPQGDSKDVVFDEAGVVEVFCEVHREMRGAIFVAENPFVAVVDSLGEFSIEGVPPGEYVIGFWSADHKELERSVTVIEGGNVRIEVELER